ncbi:MAG: F0F1 ATP synthase subunit epsilon [Candidatus Saccharicenans sp.]
MSQEKGAHLHLKVISPERLLVEAEATEVQVPGLDGYLGIWPGHRPLNACLAKGEIIYRTTLNLENRVQVNGGIIQVENDKILVFTDMKDDD